MSAGAVFAAGETGVLVLAAISVLAGLRLAREYRIVGWSLIGAGLLWLCAEVLRLLQLEAILPALSGAEHESARMLVGLLGDAVYFGVGGIAVALLFFAVVVQRSPAGDGRREPTAVARHLGERAWHYYRVRQEWERSRRGGR